MNLSRFYAVSQIEYCRNYIFRRSFPIHKIFERSCESGLWRMTANKISKIFGSRITKKLKGKLNTTLEQIGIERLLSRAENVATVGRKLGSEKDNAPYRDDQTFVKS